MEIKFRKPELTISAEERQAIEDFAVIVDEIADNCGCGTCCSEICPYYDIYGDSCSEYPIGSVIRDVIQKTYNYVKTC